MKILILISVADYGKNNDNNFRKQPKCQTIGNFSRVASGIPIQSNRQPFKVLLHKFLGGHASVRILLAVSHRKTQFNSFQLNNNLFSHEKNTHTKNHVKLQQFRQTSCVEMTIYGRSRKGAEYLFVSSGKSMPQNLPSVWPSL